MRPTRGGADQLRPWIAIKKRRAVPTPCAPGSHGVENVHIHQIQHPHELRTATHLKLRKSKSGGDGRVLKAAIGQQLRIAGP